MNQYCFTCMNELKQGDYCTECMKPNTPDGIVHHLKPGTVLNNKYLVGNSLGEGGFGITYIGRDLTLDIKVAIKEYYPNGYVNRNNETTQMVTTTTESQGDFFRKGKERFLQEARNVAKFLGEPGIVGVREYFEANNTAYIIMEYLDGENLSTYIKTHGVFPAEELFRKIMPITRSLYRIHQAGIIHRDISPDNIMILKDGTLKLTDFGSARFFTNEEKEMSVMLKQGYAPEEQYRKNGNQGPWTDVYGLSATLYRCITGQVPLDALDRMRSDELKRPSELGVNISEPLEVTLMYGLAVFPENRCKNMVEFATLIRKALNKQPVSVDKGRDVQEDIYRTKAADDVYKTMAAEGFADNRPGGMQGSNMQSGGMQGSMQGGVQRGMQGNNMQGGGMQGGMQGGDMRRDYRDQYSNVQPQNQPKKKNSMGIIIVIIVLFVSALILIGIVFGVRAALSSLNPAGPATEAETVAVDAADDQAAEADVPDVGETDFVTVPSCAGKQVSAAQQELEQLGLTVQVEYEFNEAVAKDMVIKQDVPGGTKVAKGRVVVLTVSKGSGASPYDYSQKLVVTASSGATSGTATLYEWGEGDWEKQAQYKCTLGKNGIGPGREGSSYTPQGIHKLGVVLTSTSLNTTMQTYTVTQNTCVVDDTKSPYYNTIMEKTQVPTGTSYDTIGKALCDGTTYAMIYIEHNGNGFSSSGVVAGGGSAIGVRGQYGSLKATYGDVDISSGDMQDLLKRLDASKKPMIEIKVN